MKRSVMKLAKNKYVFYIFVALALINVLGYFGTRSWECIVMFAAVAYSTRCYVKNDTLAILAGLFVSNFVFSCNKMKEGFEESMKEGNKNKKNKKSDEGDDSDSDSDDEGDDDDDDKEKDVGDNAAALNAMMNNLTKNKKAPFTGLFK